MFLAERKLYSNLNEQGLIDSRFPLWWSIGFEGRHYVRPEEFVGSLADMDGRKVRYGPDNADLSFTVMDTEIHGTSVPLFVTVKPFTKMDAGIATSDDIPHEKRFGFMVETYPHIRGIALGLDDETLLWYPTKTGLGIGNSIEIGGTELRDYSDSIDPRSFFSRLLSYHMMHHRRTYHEINHKKDDYKVPDSPFVPLFGFTGLGENMTIVPSVRSDNVHLPALVISRGSNEPVIKGFTDLKVVYRMHRKTRNAVMASVERKLGMACDAL